MLSKDVDVGSELLERRMDNHLFYCDSLRSNFSELVYNGCGQFHTSLEFLNYHLQLENIPSLFLFQDHKSQFPTEISMS